MVSDAAAPKVTLNQRSKSQSRPIKSSRPQRRQCLLSVIAGPWKKQRPQAASEAPKHLQGSSSKGKGLEGENQSVNNLTGVSPWGGIR